MEREEHENLLNELLTGELEQQRKTEILQTLRADYAETLGKIEEMTENNNKLQKDNDNLVISNSQMFRKLGDQYKTEDESEEEEQKEFSETVTLEQLEGSK